MISFILMQIFLVGEMIFQIDEAWWQKNFGKSFLGRKRINFSRFIFFQKLENSRALKTD